MLPPIATKDLTTADVDNLTTSTRDSMLKTLVEMSSKNKPIDSANSTATATAVEL